MPARAWGEDVGSPSPGLAPCAHLQTPESQGALYGGAGRGCEYHVRFGQNEFPYKWEEVRREEEMSRIPQRRWEMLWSRQEDPTLRTLAKPTALGRHGRGIRGKY